MKQKFDTIDNAHKTVREDCVDIEIAVEKLVEDKLTPEEKKKLSLEISATLTDIMFSVRKLQHKAKIYRDMANKGRR